ELYQNQRDLPRDNLLVSVEVLRFEKKRSKSENKGIMPTEMELKLEQTQQGRNQVNTSTVRITMMIADIEESRHGPSSYKDGDSVRQVHYRMLILDQHIQRNHESSSIYQERYEHVGPQDTRPQDGERSQDDDLRLDLADDLKKAQDHISSSNTSHKTKITTSKGVNLILQQEVMRNERFNYHHGYKELEITHLCFADDLLVLFHGDVNSVRVIKNALKKFSVVSRLYPNMGKSTIFCGSMDIITIDSIIQILLFKRGKLLVSTVKLRGRSVWEVDRQNNDSWIWKNLLDLRNVVRVNITYTIRNGRKASVWHDSWSDKPILDSVVSRREIYSAGFSNNDTVSMCVNGNQWNWPNEWFLKYLILSQILVPILNNKVEDMLFSNEVWSKLQTMINERDLKNLDSSMIKFSNMPCINAIWSIVRRLAIAITIYHIWHERNSRIYQQKNRSPEVLIQIIMDNVKCRLLSLKVKNSKAVNVVEEL
ncbi:hypothetical protein Tco_0618721, partial [Tanacetum coccineum]